jgi:hypothetical protein
MEQAITVTPVDHGWTVRCADCDREVFFGSGAQAEAEARNLAMKFAEAGATAVIQIYLRDGTLGGRFVHVARGRYRRWDAPAAGASASVSPPAR